MHRIKIIWIFHLKWRTHSVVNDTTKINQSVTFWEKNLTYCGRGTTPPKTQLLVGRGYPFHVRTAPFMIFYHSTPILFLYLVLPQAVTPWRPLYGRPHSCYRRDWFTPVQCNRYSGFQSLPVISDWWSNKLCLSQWLQRRVATLFFSDSDLLSICAQTCVSTQHNRHNTIIYWAWQQAVCEVAQYRDPHLRKTDTTQRFQQMVVGSWNGVKQKRVTGSFQSIGPHMKRKQVPRPFYTMKIIILINLFSPQNAGIKLQSTTDNK